jgi:hypothetical protein
MRLSICAATEGYPDEVVVRSLCKHTELVAGRIFNDRGKSQLDRKLVGYNQAAKGWLWLVLRDLNGDANCAPELRGRLLPHPSLFMQLRIVVRAIEACLMTDAERLSRYLSVPRSEIPVEPELVPNPKAEMVRLGSISRSSVLRLDMVPRQNSGAKQGPGYAARLAEFAERHWRPEIAASRSNSLEHCLSRLSCWSKHNK